jgi:hypothetical protein
VAIESVTLTQAGADLSGEGNDPQDVQRSYTDHYVVKTDAATTSPREVEDHFKRTTTLPYYGRSWKWQHANGGSTGKDAESICSKFEVEYRTRSSGVFDVTAGFTPKDSGSKQQQPDLKGEQTDDPNRWLEVIEVGGTQISIPAEAAIFRGFRPAVQNNKLEVGKEYPPCNSAMVPFDPPPEKLQDIEVIRLQKYVRSVDGFGEWRGKINNDFFTIDKFANYAFKRVFAPYAVWMKEAGGVSERINGLPWFLRTIELWVKSDTWFTEYVDRGVHRRVAIGDPDGNGGVLSGSSSRITNQVRPLSEVLKDEEGYPMTTPVLLNGNGQPLKDLTRPIWMKWQLQGDTKFANMQW